MSRTLVEWGAEHRVHQTMIAAWKRQAIEGMVATFGTKTEATPNPACPSLNRVNKTEDWDSLLEMEAMTMP